MTDHRHAQALNDVLDEMDLQDRKWGGDINHPPMTWGAILSEEVGEYAQASLHYQFGGPKAIEMRNEAVQVAAVALQIIEYLDRHEFMTTAKLAAEHAESG